MGTPTTSAAAILRLISSGEAKSRSSLARQTGLAPSTISLRVETLSSLGLVEEVGDEESRGGRKARRLRLVKDAGSVVAVDLGAHHVTIAVADLSGDILSARTVTIQERDADAFVGLLWREVRGQLENASAGRLLGLCIGAPAPIEHPSGRLVLPSFMPAWDRVDLPSLLAAHTDVPVMVENDANLSAVAEIAAGASDRPQHLLAVKLGSRIGCGVVSDGRLHRGRWGAAGEISHTQVAGEATIPCTCGTPRCLESVASGGALVARLAAEGYEVSTPRDVVELARAGNPRATEALREAGASIGGVLAALVNFFNPGDVVLGGSLSASAPLVAAIRAELFQRCLPIAAEDLDVRAAKDSETTGIRGAVHLILEEVLSVVRIDRMIRARTDEFAPTF
jgi:predicted NBD/HSP70 family sugar kinase